MHAFYGGIFDSSSNFITLLLIVVVNLTHWDQVHYIIYIYTYTSIYMLKICSSVLYFIVPRMGESKPPPVLYSQ